MAILCVRGHRQQQFAELVQADGVATTLVSGAHFQGLRRARLQRKNGRETQCLSNTDPETEKAVFVCGDALRPAAD